MQNQKINLNVALADTRHYFKTTKQNKKHQKKKSERVRKRKKNDVYNGVLAIKVDSDTKD